MSGGALTSKTSAPSDDAVRRQADSFGNQSTGRETVRIVLASRLLRPDPIQISVRFDFFLPRWETHVSVALGLQLSEKDYFASGRESRDVLPTGARILSYMRVSEERLA